MHFGVSLRILSSFFHFFFICDLCSYRLPRVLRHERATGSRDRHLQETHDLRAAADRAAEAEQVAIASGHYINMTHVQAF